MLYNETTTTLYKRANVIVINNELNMPPEITFQEQYATAEGEAVDGRVGSCTLVMPSEEDATFPLEHPITGDPLGEASFQSLQVMLHSLYLYTASIRDNPPVEVPVGVDPTEVVGPTEEETTDGSN